MSFPTILTSETDVNFNGSNWILTGFTPSAASGGYSPVPFGYSPPTLLLGIALTDMLIPLSGRICIYENSHILLQNDIKQQIELKSNIFSLPYDSTGQKPILKEPSKVILL